MTIVWIIPWVTKKDCIGSLNLKSIKKKSKGVFNMFILRFKRFYYTQRAYLFLWIFRNSFLKGRFTEYCWRRFIISSCNSGDLSTEIHLKKRGVKSE